MPNTTPYLLQPAPSRKNIPRVEDMDMDQITFDIDNFGFAFVPSVESSPSRGCMCNSRGIMVG
ncbi:hypothetical protein I7I53_01633 [Histoplasma capsulatum var. duboisii H88]|uniref:Uncharacterized protein n=1 Tax=Ajellomyces capsulatus (strain H88) TaxID=544711 RepID=A0A8A1LL10_AJEC8|nr:hypothetical protein I7I53_01633 [Histoplasma capsulatum var. duboisii H88]